MAFAYLGNTFMAPLFGVIAQYTTIKLLPLYVGFFGIVMIILTEYVNGLVKKRAQIAAAEPQTIEEKIK
jgi:fucose permease